MSKNFTESVLEEAVLGYLRSQGWQVYFGLEIAPGYSAPKNALLPRLMSGEVRKKAETN